MESLHPSEIVLFKVCLAWQKSIFSACRLTWNQVFSSKRKKKLKLEFPHLSVCWPLSSEQNSVLFTHVYWTDDSQEC